MELIDHQDAVDSESLSLHQFGLGVSSKLTGKV